MNFKTLTTLLAAAALALPASSPAQQTQRIETYGAWEFEEENPRSDISPEQTRTLTPLERQEYINWASEFGGTVPADDYERRLDRLDPDLNQQLRDELYNRDETTVPPEADTNTDEILERTRMGDDAPPAREMDGEQPVEDPVTVRPYAGDPIGAQEAIDPGQRVLETNFQRWQPIPTVEVDEAPAKYMAQIDLPGIDPGDITVYVNNRILTVTAKTTAAERQRILQRSTFERSQYPGAMHNRSIREQDDGAKVETYSDALQREAPDQPLDANEQDLPPFPNYIRHDQNPAADNIARDLKPSEDAQPVTVNVDEFRPPVARWTFDDEPAPGTGNFNRTEQTRNPGQRAPTRRPQTVQEQRERNFERVTQSVILPRDVATLDTMAWFDDGKLIIELPKSDDERLL